MTHPPGRVSVSARCGAPSRSARPRRWRSSSRAGSTWCTATSAPPRRSTRRSPPRRRARPSRGSWSGSPRPGRR
ncbi:hypothetical protein FXF68_11675 [Actinomadura decatromicini]|uniref:Uncharacterized protein n=1 Tax=Actinomadura decatromicini TaxID=2604572 RepID=A0A5D3FTP9_9ACTN|nr:hypothetical protein FXF68_11675 [Actinomadura decatromicini]